MSAEAQDAARRYIKHGLAVIPVDAGEKNPGRDEWQNERWAIEDVPRLWNNGQGVGILWGESSGGLVDIDCDWPEAWAVAEYICPQTRTFGRPSAPASHYVLRATGTIPKTKRYKIPGKGDDNAVVELLSTGTQSLAPPSLHGDSGERRQWYHERPTAEVDGAECAALAADIATAALLVHSWPGEGARHDYVNAAAGYIGRNLPRDRAERVMHAAIRASGDEEATSRFGDVRDTLDKLPRREATTGGPTLEQLAPGVMDQLRRWHGWERREGRHDQGQPEKKEDRRNQADRLIGYALADAQELFADQHGAPHALIGGEPVPLTSRCYSWLRRIMWEREKRAVNGEYLKTAAGTLAAHAEFSGDVRELHTRAAWHERALYYELRPGRVVKIDAGGWSFESEPPVLFRRYPNLKPLPDPEPDGSLAVLDEMVNLKTERDRRLFKAYLVTAPLPHVGRPILGASGAMGSGKTTLQRIIKRSWDPTAPETVRLDPRDFLQKASHAFVLMLDNQNTIPEWGADTLCRLVTGEADSKRRLYTDDEDVIIELKRAVLLNGINVPTDRGDVLDRSLVIELERIPDEKRRPEEELWERFEAEHPKLLGALFDTLAGAIAHKASLKLSRRPRLADWGEYAAAVYEVMDWGAERFLEDWDEVVKVQNQATLDGSPVAQAILKFMEDKEEYADSPSDLHKKLEGVAESLGVSIVRDKAWPKSARWLWRRIKEVLPLLAAAGIQADRREAKSGSQITLRKVPKNDATNATAGESGLGKGKTGGNRSESNATSNATGDESNATGGIKGGNTATSNATRKADSYGKSENGGISGIRNGDFSEEYRSEAPLSADLKPGETSTLADLRARRAQDGADQHPLTCECVECAAPAWLKRQVELYRTGKQTRVRRTNPTTGKVETYPVRVSIKNVCAAVAAQIGMDPLGWEAIRDEVEEALGSWEGIA